MDMTRMSRRRAGGAVRDAVSEPPRTCLVRAVTTVLAVALAVLMLALAASSADALIAQGHTYAETFEPQGAEQLKDPTGIAVDEASGELFVIDRTLPTNR